MHPPICIWVDIAPKREKTEEKCIFFFAKQQICNTHIAKHRLTSIECPRREEGESEGEWGKRQRRRRKKRKWGRRENEEKRGEKILRERFSRARVDAHRCAHSNRNVVFLLSQVSHFGGIRRKNWEKMQEKWGYIRKNPREKRCLSMLSCVYLEDSIDVLLKYTKENK